MLVSIHQSDLVGFRLLGFSLLFGVKLRSGKVYSVVWRLARTNNEIGQNARHSTSPKLVINGKFKAFILQETYTMTSLIKGSFSEMNPEMEKYD